MSLQMRQTGAPVGFIFSARCSGWVLFVLVRAGSGRSEGSVADPEGRNWATVDEPEPHCSGYSGTARSTKLYTNINGRSTLTLRFGSRHA